MRFYEFAPTKYLQTPVVSNVPAEPITQVRNVPVIPDEIKHQRVQQFKAAEIARSANQVQPTQQDLEMAWFHYGQAQGEANKELERQRAEQVAVRRKQAKRHP